MKVSDFINQCIDEGCEWAKGANEGQPGYFVKHDKWGTCAHFTPQAILANDFGKLFAHVHQGRDVKHISRVVGYYSRVENWNVSKKAELRDRQKGSYSPSSIKTG